MARLPRRTMPVGARGRGALLRRVDVRAKDRAPPGRARHHRGGHPAEAAMAAVTASEHKIERGGQHMESEMRILTVAALTLALGSQVLAAEPWQQEIASGLGKPGTEMPGGIYRVSLPRTDLKVTLDGVEIKPALALGSWLAFKPMGQDVMVMGDLVLTDSEVNPVMERLGEGGIDITALHNHLLRGTPNTMYMHVHGHGDPTKLATTLREALGQSKTPFGGETAGISPEAATQAATTASTSGKGPDIDTAAIDQALGRKGKANGPVYQVSVPRAETPKDNGMEVPEAMGLAIAINFQATAAGK